jgi:pilus assembly protein Flp/PilA
MFTNIKRLLKDDEGATLVEYGLLVALIAAACIVVVTTLGQKIVAVFTATSAAIVPPAG